MKWNDVKLYQFNKLQELLRIENDEERLVEICSLFFEKDILELPLTEFKQKVKELDFLKEDIPSNIPPKKITVNGKKYYFDCLLGNITTAQYVDFINYSKTNDIVKIISVFLIPQGHKYNDGSYDIADVINDIYELPITVVNDAAFFFAKQFSKFMEIFQSYSIKNLKKAKLNKKVEKQLIKAMKSSVDLALYPLSSNFAK